MITGMISQFRELENAPFRFELTGSRALGNTTEHSDWDFFCQDSPEVEDFLYRNMFSIDDISSYETSTRVFKKGDIHIQLVKDFDHKLRAQKFIMKSELRMILCHLDKKQRKHVWNFALGQTQAQLTIR